VNVIAQTRLNKVATITYAGIRPDPKETSIPGYGSVSVPKQCLNDSGASAIKIKVSGSRLDFGTVSAGGATFSMQGNFTTDIISGTMTATTPYGVIKGEFHLNRKR